MPTTIAWGSALIEFVVQAVIAASNRAFAAFLMLLCVLSVALVIALLA